MKVVSFVLLTSTCTGHDQSGSCSPGSSLNVLHWEQWNCIEMYSNMMPSLSDHFASKGCYKIILIQLHHCRINMWVTMIYMMGKCCTFQRIFHFGIENTTHFCCMNVTVVMVFKIVHVNVHDCQMMFIWKIMSNQSNNGI